MKNLLLMMMLSFGVFALHGSGFSDYDSGSGDDRDLTG